MGEFSISHLNMMHSYLGASFLDTFSSSNDIHKSFIISINEPIVNKSNNKITNLKNFSLYYNNLGGSTKPRAVIATRGPGFKVLFLNNISDGDIAVAEITLDNGLSFYFISLYLPSDSTPEVLEKRLDELHFNVIEKIGNNNKPIILCSDSNARCVELGELPHNHGSSTKYDPRKGRLLVDFIFNSNLKIRNAFSNSENYNPSFTSLCGKRSSVVDLIATSEHEFFEDSTCILNTKPTLVDHKHLILVNHNFHLNLPKLKFGHFRYNTKVVTDWTPFEESLKKHYGLIKKLDFETTQSTWY